MLYKIINRLLNVHTRVLSALKLTYLNLSPKISISLNSNIHYQSSFDIGSSEKKFSGHAIQIGDKTKIKKNALLASRGGYIHIGNNCSINPNCILLGYGGIKIEIM